MTVISRRRRKQKKGERSKLRSGEWESKFLVPTPHSLLPSYLFRLYWLYCLSLLLFEWARGSTAQRVRLNARLLPHLTRLKRAHD
jgi:hypothetical protein